MSDSDVHARLAALESAAVRGAEGSIRAELATNPNVRPEVAASAAKMARIEGNLRIDATGAAVLTFAGRDYDIQDGLKAFLKMPEAAIFLKATRTAARPSTKPAPDSKETPAARTKRQFEALGIKGRIGS